jgi:hypothetical protein
MVCRAIVAVGNFLGTIQIKNIWILRRAGLVSPRRRTFSGMRL